MLDTHDPALAGRARWARRLGGAPLWAHALALAGVLLVVGQLLGPGTYSADEGAAIIEARSLAEGEGWIVEHPLPDADPTGARYPLELSEWGERGTAPYAKHPLYPVLLAVADRVGGVRAMVALSALGTAAAAMVAAALGRRLRAGIEQPTLWVVGLASPLLFGSTWVIAHNLGAAAVGAALVAALRAGERADPRWSLVAAGLLGVALALRTEAVVVAGALVLVALVQALRGRGGAWAWTAGAAVAAVLVTRWAEGRAHSAILGESRPAPRSPSAAGDGSLVGDRWAGFVQTWLRPGGGTGAALLLAALALFGFVTWKVARGEHERVLVRRFAVVAAALVVVRALLLPADAVPGLLVAFPLLWVGIALAPRGLVTDRSGRNVAVGLAGVSGVAALGILATQYRAGGTAEWGGRYFAVLLPLVTPLAVAGLAERAARIDARSRRVLGGSLLAATAALSLLAMREVRGGRERSERAVDAIEQAVAGLPVPVILATEGAVPRTAWRTFPEQRWLLVDPADPAVVPDLLAAGVDRFVVVSRDVEGALAQLGGLRRVPGAPKLGGIAVVEAIP
ncbi:MAG: hypothetical protein Q8K58_07080 [Acidimicrobiales bacterium]|nr:hypothetical protein [Acidimicrobiales bacterium]